MTLKSRIYYLTAPRKFRRLTLLTMGLVGVMTLAMAAWLTQDSALLVDSLGQGIAHSPLALAIDFVKSIF